MKQERTKILTAFGDISGSGIYGQRATDAKKEVLPFWGKFDDLIDDFEVNHEFFMKHLGDGFLAILKINGKNGFQTIRFLNELFILKGKIEKLIKNSKPRPDGFRIHVAAGEAIQKIQTNGEVIFHGYHLDLIGTTIKTDQLKSIPFIVHASAKDLMTSREIAVAGFQFDPLIAPKMRRSKETIYKEDMGRLYALSK